FFSAPTAIDSVPKLVVPFVIPAIVAVPGFPAVRRMSTALIDPPPLVGRTLTPLTVKTSVLLVPETESVTVIAEVVFAHDAAVMFLLPVNEALQVPAWNSQFAGAVRISVVFLCGVAKSPLLPSVMT